MSEAENFLNKYAKRSNLLHIEPSGDGETAKLTFDIIMKKDEDPQVLSTSLSRLSGVSEVVLVASKNDADY